ncbi:thioredoxin fold domain-containing protein [uncultured Alistipes sp.]|uniref:thioredoxin family protein n=1 Tax=uncultured Alistipes sp. TaxID=538949 RepID=UPI0026185C16|nr:thioredoxin fold domain-containing protein [uncultured Alistipes sp.]
MKKILFTLLLVIGVAVAANAQVRFTDKNLDAVREEATQQNKLVFIDLYATWCGPCKNMERNVFSQPEVGDFMAQHFIAAKYDIDKPTGSALAKKYGIRSIPTFLIFDTEGTLLGQITGGMPADDFIRAVEEILKKYK